MKVSFKPNVSVIPDKRRPLRKEGKDNVFRLVTRAYWNVDGKPVQLDFRLSVDATEKEFNAAVKSPNTVEGHTKKVADEIALANKKIDAILQDRDTVTPKDFKHLYKTIEVGADTLDDAKSIWSYYQQKINEDKTDSPKNAWTYEQSRNDVRRYAPNLHFRDITVKWLADYQKDRLKKHLSQTSINFYLKSLRYVYRKALKDKVFKTDSYPWGDDGHQIKRTEGRKIALDLNQFRALKKLQFHEDDDIRYGVSFWLLSFYFCGINNADTCRLTYDNVKHNLLKKVRHKTRNTSGTELMLPLDNYTDEINFIIETYGVKRPDNKKPKDWEFIFPWLAEDLKGLAGKKKFYPAVKWEDMTEKQKCGRADGHLKRVNAGLAKAEKLLKVPFEIRTYSARHTFARLFLQVLEGTKKELQFLLGHASIETTELYCKDWTDLKVTTENLGAMKKMLEEPTERKHVVMKVTKRKKTA